MFLLFYLNKIIVFPLIFPLVFEISFEVYNALIFFPAIDLAVVGSDMQSGKISCLNL